MHPDIFSRLVLRAGAGIFAGNLGAEGTLVTMQFRIGQSMIRDS